ncbi:hypothetical protein SLEP1_g17606 [Rubroshorea leprosula]|uniref:RRM domain-containing protein n=1 Tax=Rubroshorea leprosula TaxID=152421 RepID=A0AAV5J5C1_9ROSI|nr:hypothetical protein SLEP1_g17606 [Rubroshorea leprosula]
MRERGRERNRDLSYRLHARSGRAALSREFAGSRGRSRQRRSVDTGYRSVSRSKKFNHDWGYNRGIYKQATTFFFSNIPNDWNYNDMWKTFGRYGRLISIYSPQRRNQFGRRFGFLKYIEVRNARDLEVKLDQIWVAGRKIWVNIAKYPEEKIVAKKKSLLSKPSMVVEGKSYADAVKGQEEIKYGKTGSQLKQIRSETVYGKKGSILKNSKTEQRKIWRVKNRGTEWRGLEYNVKEEDYEWLQGCYVGIAHSVEMVPNIQEKFYIEGYFSCRLRAMGGKMVLMDCEDKEELKDLVQGAADWLGQWFSEVKPWSPLMVAKERFVWIRCQGTPLQVWGPAFFESMAVPWGKFICLDDSTSQKRRFDIARFLISTQIMDLISVKRQITVNGEVYCLKFTEEEMTNSLFSLRYDFLPSFKSDSEHEEYWSEASEYDDEWQDDEWGTNRERAGEEEKAVGDTVGHSTNDRRQAVSAANEEEFELEERGDEAGQFEKAEGSLQYRLKEWDTAEEVADSIVEGTVYEVQVGRDEKGREKEASSTNQISSDPIQATGEELRFEQVAQSKGNMGHNQNVVKGLVERKWACNKKGAIDRTGPTLLNTKTKKKGRIINLKTLEDVRRTHSSSLTADKGIEDSNGMDGSNKVGVSTQRVSEGDGIQMMISKQPQEAGISAQVELVEKEVQLQILKKKGPKGAKEVTSVEKEGDPVQWEHEHEAAQLQIQKQKGSKGAEAGFFEEAEGISVQVPVNKNRKKRSKSCHAVYLKAQLSGVMIRNKEGRGRPKESKPGTVDFPEFLSNGRNSVAGDSVGDSGIENCNRILKEEQSRKTAEDLWDFAKRIGVVAEDEVGVIRDLEEMERRDRKEKEAEGSKGGNKHKKETKMVGINRSSCRMIWGSDDFEWVARDAEGLSGGMLCIWNSKKFKMGRVLAGMDFIGVEGAWGVEQCPASIINVYSPCQLGKKRILWEELKALVAGRSGNWCIMGDFNAVRKVGERGGSREISTEMREFDGFIRDVGLVDLPLIGRKFTWVQASGHHMSRIDRFLLSEGWLNKWGDAKQWGLNRTVSDHCPILLKQQVVDWGPKPFKFFDSWLEQEGCRELIKETWSKADIQGWAGYRIKEKLKLIKEALRKWSKDFAPEIDNKINTATTEIAQIDLKGEAVQLSEEEIKKRREAFLALWDSIKHRESMLQQKSRKTWLRLGDANTRFFHNCVKGRWRRSEINSVQVNGAQIAEARQMKEEISSFFEQLYKEEKQERPRLDGVVFQQISQDDNEILIAPFSEEEIKEAIRDCDSSKAPGPDGFNFKFVKDQWEVIKADVIQFLQEFQGKSKLVKGLNTSFIALVPKVDNPQKIEEYRPISLIGVVYKILAKILANRLKKVLDTVIGDQQMAFLRGRQLMDGVVIANEVVEEAKKKKKKAFLFKIDFEKAYDKVSWDFLDYMMQRMGFCAKWRNWIQECLRTSLVSVLGSFPFKYLGIPIGGRYGKIAFWKPLIDIFSKKLSKWKGRFLSLGGRITLINSVLDSLPVFWMSVYLIPKGTILLLDQIRRRFLWGGTEGGKKINWVKWEVVCKDKKKGGLGVKDLRKFNMALLGKWWGKLVSEEKGLWKKIIFEKYGRAGEHSYYWLRKENNSGTKWWRDICRVNTIAGEKRGWIADGFNLKVGEGVSTKFWWDNWRGEGCLANKYPRLYSLSTGKDDKFPQMGEWLNGKWEWNLQWRRNLFSWETQQAGDLQKDIQDIRLIRGKPDLWEWAHSKDGTYSTNSAYQILTRETRTEQHGMELQNVWNKLIPNKISAFSWQLLQDKIPTKLNLHKRGIIPTLEDCKCALCGREAENTSHLFIHCNFAWHLWNACFKWWGFIHVLDKDCWKVFQQLPNPLSRAKWKEGWECIWFGIVWSLWLARNEKIFREKEPDRRRLLELVQIRTFRWLKSRDGGCVFSLSDWLHNPTDCLTSICKQQAKSHIQPKARPSLQD